jgi:hypothetical protein
MHRGRSNGDGRMRSPDTAWEFPYVAIHPLGTPGLLQKQIIGEAGAMAMW